MDFNTPQNMMTSLLGEIRSALIHLMEISKVSLDDICDEANSYKTIARQTVDQLDLLEILNYLWRNWDTLKEKIFTCDHTNAYGAPYRSYLSLIITARNEWAHKYTYSYEDVLHNSFITQKFFGSARRKVNISIVDQIIESCLQEISGRHTNIPAEPAIEVTNDYATFNNHGECIGVIETDNEDGSTGLTEINAEDENKQEGLEQEKQSEFNEHVEKNIEKDEEGTRIYITKEELKEVLSGLLTDFRENLVAENSSTDYSDEEELEQEESDDFEGVAEEEQGVLVHSLVHPDEVEAKKEQEDLEAIEDLEDHDEYSTDEVSEVIEFLKARIENKDYSNFYKLMGFKSSPTVRPGTYPHTLYIAAEGPIWGSWGDIKLKLVEENLFDVLLFALVGYIPDHMKGEWEGTELICIPSKEKARVQFGRNKARMLCASMDRISKWLENYYLS